MTCFLIANILIATTIIRLKVKLNLMPKTAIKPKKSYRIMGFQDDCPQHYMQKLLSLGFIPGECFYVVKKALFGNPYHIIIRNFSVSLRNTDLALIQLQTV